MKEVSYQKIFYSLEYLQSLAWFSRLRFPRDRMSFIDKNQNKNIDFIFLYQNISLESHTFENGMGKVVVKKSFKKPAT